MSCSSVSSYVVLLALVYPHSQLHQGLIWEETKPCYW